MATGVVPRPAPGNPNTVDEIGGSQRRREGVAGDAARQRHGRAALGKEVRTCMYYGFVDADMVVCAKYRMVWRRVGQTRSWTRS